MIKVSTFLAESEHGPSVVPLFGPADPIFEKTASIGLRKEVLSYISSLRPQKESQYVLVNALGAGEFWGSNVNADLFDESGLIHCPEGWTGNPLLDRQLSKDWLYGFPTFYQAHAFAHHRNKDPSRAYGDVELAVWNDHMRRVELVIRVDYDKCCRYGGVPIWDKLKAGQYVDVSMGTRVCFDLCSITTDWKTYHKALATFDPKKHKHPGMAVLEHHKSLKAKDGKGIRGLSITRHDYSEPMRKMPNCILPDGRKVFVHNPFPRFFDISFVFIGADRTAKVMVFIVRAGQTFGVPSALAAEKMGLTEESLPEPNEKKASIEDEILLAAFRKRAAEKQGEIDKEVKPNLPPGKAVPLLTKSEADLPENMLDALSSVPISKALSTLTGLGMLLRPREFQKVVLTHAGHGALAKDLESKNAVFPKSDEEIGAGMGAKDFLPALARLLSPAMVDRSALGPIIERRMVFASRHAEPRPEPSSHSSDLLRKIGAAYNGYRRGVIEVVAEAQNLLESAAGTKDSELRKLAEASPEELFTPLTFQYLTTAFLEEVPVGASFEPVVENSPVAGVERGLPSRNTWI